MFKNEVANFTGYKLADKWIVISNNKTYFEGNIETPAEFKEVKANGEVFEIISYETVEIIEEPRKAKRIFIHFNKNGKDLGTYGIFENDKNHNSLINGLKISKDTRTVFLTKETHRVAKSITGMTL
jgi:hypothetical protein